MTLPAELRAEADRKRPGIPHATYVHDEVTRALLHRAADALEAVTPDDSGPVFSGRVIRFDTLAEQLLPVAQGGYNCAGPQDWRFKEAIRAVLNHLYPLPATPEG